MITDSEDRILQSIGKMQLEQANKTHENMAEHIDDRLEVMFEKICAKINEKASTGSVETGISATGKN